MELFSVFLTTDAWITLAILIFLEVVLGIDNLVFIALTTNRLPESKQKLGRRFGLIAAMFMRILFLCFASWLVSFTAPLFYLPFEIGVIDSAISGKDLILFIGAIYLIYKGIAEIKETLSLEDMKESHGHPHAKKTQIGLIQAVATIAVMDIVFSIDSVITAVGLAGGMLLVMILAVMLAVFIMIIFADFIAKFINSHPEMKLLALIFIMLIGIKLIIESLGIELYIEGTEVSALNIALYSIIVVSLVLTTLQITYARRSKALLEEIAQHAEKQPDAASSDLVTESTEATEPDEGTNQTDQDSLTVNVD